MPGHAQVAEHDVHGLRLEQREGRRRRRAAATTS